MFFYVLFFFFFFFFKQKTAYEITEGDWSSDVCSSDLIGFVGLSIPGFAAHFTPCVEIGWRLAFDHWGRGYATEAARLVVAHRFGPLGLAAVVSFTAVANRRSQAVMERLGMRRDPAEDFDHPDLPESHPLRRHVLYRLGSGSYCSGSYFDM